MDVEKFVNDWLKDRPRSTRYDLVEAAIAQDREERAVCSKCGLNQWACTKCYPPDPFAAKLERLFMHYPLAVISKFPDGYRILYERGEFCADTPLAAVEAALEECNENS